MRYIIDRKTNEHERYDGQNYDATKYRIVEADSEGWIAHTGNECPLPEDARCEYKMRDGDLSSDRARHLRWSHQGINCDADIVAYRPILAEKVQEPEPIPAPQYDPRSVSFNLLDRLKAAHAHAQQIPDLEAELRKVLAGIGYDLVARSPFVNQCCGNPAQCWEPCGELGKSEAHVAVSPEPDMTDWRNWREGDLVEVINQYYDHCFSIGRIVRIANITKRRIDCEAGGVAWSMGADELRFHSRPAKGGEVMALEGWEIVQADSRHISIKHPDGTWATIADTGPINNMMFYELCLAILKAQEQK